MTTGSPAPTSEVPPGAQLERISSSPKTFGTPPGRRHFLIRRLHSLTGLVFGGYIVTHLMINATGIWPHDYQANVNKIHSLEPNLWIIELTTIFIPLLIHALYGIYIVKAGVKFNTTKYAYGGNIRYTLQRVTAVILLAFIAFHVGTLHKWGLLGLHYNIDKVHPAPSPLPHNDQGQVDFTKFDPIQRFSWWCSEYGGLFQADNQAYQTTVNGVRNLLPYPDDPLNEHLHLGSSIFMGFYLLGIWSATFHLANGLWTSAIAWGLTVTANAQKRWGHVCLGIGIVVTIFGTIAWYAFTFSPNAVPDKVTHVGLERWDSDYVPPDDTPAPVVPLSPAQLSTAPTQPAATAP